MAVCVEIFVLKGLLLYIMVPSLVLSPIHCFAAVACALFCITFEFRFFFYFVLNIIIILSVVMVGALCYVYF